MRHFFSYNFRKYFLVPFKIIRMAIIDTMRHDGVEHAGYLAFLSILSLFPALMFFVALIGFIGASDIGIHYVEEFFKVIPQDIARGIAPRVKEIVSGPPQSFLTIAIIGIIWTASSSVEGCRTILNRAYRVVLPPPYLWRRLLSIAQFFIIISAIIAGIFFLVVIPIVFNKLSSYLPFAIDVNFDVFYLRQIMIFMILVLTTSLLFYILPNVKQKITQTIPGAILTVSCWICLQKGFLFYLKTFHQFNLVYGSLTGVIVSLMFFYLVSLVFIVGAEFNYHFHRVYKIFLK